MNAKLPTIADLSSLLKGLKAYIGDRDRASGCEDDTAPSMDITIGWDDATGKWSYQTGDNSFTGGAYGYPHWACVLLHRRANTRDLARDIRSQLDELASA